MKSAKRGLGEDERGVSPVVGIVLLLAIVVTAATGLFILLGNAGAESQGPVTASFEVDRGGPGGEITVLKLGTEPIETSTLTINPTSCTLRDGGGTSKTSGPLEAGDFLDCTADGQVTIADGASGRLLFRGTI